ncbi:acyltransferase [Salmonella enterica]|nr:acyltransferase [Salmonella enterica]EKY7631051.1 acyltransferase [Salmonella enterica]
MDNLLPLLSIHNSVYAFSFVTFAVCVCYVLNKFVDISPIGSHNDLSLEGLRGVACLLVFVNHSYTVIAAIGLKSPYMNIQPAYAFEKMGAFGVSIFFCLTGFLFSSTIKKGIFDISFFQKRIYRLLPAYVVVSTIVFAIFMFQRYGQIKTIDEVMTVIRSVYGFGFWGGGIRVGSIWDWSLNIVTWTLPYEWKYYAAVPFLACAFAIKPLRISLIPLALIIIYLGYQNEQIMWTYFLTGFIASYIKQPANNYLKYALWIVMPLLFIYSIFGDFKVYEFEMFCATSIFFMAFIASRPSIFSKRSISNIGIISYSLYLVHQLSLNITFNSYSKFINLEQTSARYFILMQFGAITLAIILSAILYNKIEKRYKIK